MVDLFVSIGFEADQRYSMESGKNGPKRIAGGDEREGGKRDKSRRTEKDLVPVISLPLCCSRKQHMRTNNFHQQPR